MEKDSRSTSVTELRHRLAAFGAKNRAHYEQNRVQKSYCGYSTRQKILEFENLCASQEDSYPGSASTYSKSSSTRSKNTGTKEYSSPPPSSRAGHGAAGGVVVPPPKVARFRDFSNEIEKDFDTEGFRILSLQETNESKDEQPFPSRWGASSDALEQSLQDFLGDDRDSWSEGEIDFDESSSSDDETPGDEQSNKYYRETQSLGGTLRASNKKSFRHRLAHRLKPQGGGTMGSRFERLLCKSKREKEPESLSRKGLPLNLDFSSVDGSKLSVEATAASSKHSSDFGPVRCNENENLTSGLNGYLTEASATDMNDMASWSQPRSCSPKGQTVQDESIHDGLDSHLESILPGALTGSLVEVFGDEKRRARTPSAVQPPETFKVSSQSLIVRSMGSNSDRKSNGSVALKVERFGGIQAHQSAVESRKAQLERKWAEDRQPVAIKKKAWQVCQKTGKYKKKVVLNYI